MRCYANLSIIAGSSSQFARYTLMLSFNCFVSIIVHATVILLLIIVSSTNISYIYFIYTLHHHLTCFIPTNHCHHNSRYKNVSLLLSQRMTPHVKNIVSFTCH